MSALLSPSAPAAFAAAANAEREFDFSAEDFERIRRLIYQRAGINLHPGK
jgi:chemotaxis protein methyltransferase CheR